MIFFENILYDPYTGVPCKRIWPRKSVWQMGCCVLHNTTTWFVRRTIRNAHLKIIDLTKLWNRISLSMQVGRASRALRNLVWCTQKSYNGIVNSRPVEINLILSRKQISWGQHGAHLGPVDPRWAPCWPHEPCYQGSCLIRKRRWQRHFLTAGSILHGTPAPNETTY